MTLAVIAHTSHAGSVSGVACAGLGASETELGTNSATPRISE